jgi:predicted nucleic acid-binding protein
VKIYLDICAIQRPLDTSKQIRIVLETEAVLGILALCDEGKIELVSSEALIYETEQNPILMRREHANAVLARAKNVVKVTDETKARAVELLKLGFKSLDSLHLALAEFSEVDYFCTCDDQLIRISKRTDNLQVKVISPLDLIQEIENDYRN